MAELVEMGAERVLVCDGDGPLIDAEPRATDLVGDALSVGATMIAVPVARLAPDFFRLRSGLAGAVAQKVINYRMRLAVVGDISAAVAVSEPLRDWVAESNRRGEVLFVADLAALAERLERVESPNSSVTPRLVPGGEGSQTSNSSHRG